MAAPHGAIALAALLVLTFVVGTIGARRHQVQESASPSDVPKAGSYEDYFFANLATSSSESHQSSIRSQMMASFTSAIKQVGSPAQELVKAASPLRKSMPIRTSPEKAASPEEESMIVGSPPLDDRPNPFLSKASAPTDDEAEDGSGDYTDREESSNIGRSDDEEEFIFASSPIIAQTDEPDGPADQHSGAEVPQAARSPEELMFEVSPTTGSASGNPLRDQDGQSRFTAMSPIPEHLLQPVPASPFDATASQASTMPGSVYQSMPPSPYQPQTPPQVFASPPSVVASTELRAQTPGSPMTSHDSFVVSAHAAQVAEARMTSSPTSSITGQKSLPSSPHLDATQQAILAPRTASPLLPSFGGSNGQEFMPSSQYHGATQQAMRRERMTASPILPDFSSSRQEPMLPSPSRAASSKVSLAAQDRLPASPVFQSFTNKGHESRPSSPYHAARSKATDPPSDRLASGIAASLGSAAVGARPSSVAASPGFVTPTPMVRPDGLISPGSKLARHSLGRQGPLHSPEQALPAISPSRMAIAKATSALKKYPPSNEPSGLTVAFREYALTHPDDSGSQATAALADAAPDKPDDVAESEGETRNDQALRFEEFVANEEDAFADQQQQQQQEEQQQQPQQQQYSWQGEAAAEENKVTAIVGKTVAKTEDRVAQIDNHIDHTDALNADAVAPHNEFIREEEYLSAEDADDEASVASDEKEGMRSRFAEMIASAKTFFTGTDDSESDEDDADRLRQPSSDDIRSNQRSRRIESTSEVESGLVKGQPPSHTGQDGDWPRINKQHEVTEAEELAQEASHAVSNAAEALKNIKVDEGYGQRGSEKGRSDSATDSSYKTAQEMELPEPAESAETPLAAAEKGISEALRVAAEANGEAFVAARAARISAARARAASIASDTDEEQPTVSRDRGEEIELRGDGLKEWREAFADVKLGAIGNEVVAINDEVSTLVHDTIRVTCRFKKPALRKALDTVLDDLKYLRKQTMELMVPGAKNAFQKYSSLGTLRSKLLDLHGRVEAAKLLLHLSKYEDIVEMSDILADLQHIIEGPGVVQMLHRWLLPQVVRDEATLQHVQELRKRAEEVLIRFNLGGEAK